MISATQPRGSVLIANTDLGNFSLSKPGSAEYEGLVKKIHDATLKAGKWLGATHLHFPASRAPRTSAPSLRRAPASLVNWLQALTGRTRLGGGDHG